MPQGQYFYSGRFPDSGEGYSFLELFIELQALGNNASKLNERTEHAKSEVDVERLFVFKGTANINIRI